MGIEKAAKFPVISPGVSEFPTIINTPDNIPSNETELSYDAVNILRTDFNTIDKSNIDLLVICIYKLNSSDNNFLTTYPYLEYLLYKYPSDFKKKSLQNTETMAIYCLGLL